MVIIIELKGCTDVSNNHALIMASNFKAKGCTNVPTNPSLVSLLRQHFIVLPIRYYRSTLVTMSAVSIFFFIYLRLSFYYLHPLPRLSTIFPKPSSLLFYTSNIPPFSLFIIYYIIATLSHFTKKYLFYHLNF